LLEYYKKSASKTLKSIRSVDEMTKDQNLNGLRSWLILVGLGVVISPIKMIIQDFSLYSEMFSSGAFATLTTPGTKAYNPLWSPILFTELTINSGLFVASIFVAFLFFSKKKLFPKWYISVLLFSLIFILIDALAVKLVLPKEPVFDAVTAKEFIRTLISSMIWVPYMLVSKRVKATFIK
jgi:Protein of unknown function (DUF2569)